MSATIPAPAPEAVEYPDSDGRRMAENTRQYEWIVALKGNLDIQFRDDPNVFVAGDHLIYAVEGRPKRRRAPDVYVAFGRPKGHRGSYKLWDEGGVFPQVVFEVLSPKNTRREMLRKKAFYLRYGAEEFYIINPLTGRVRGWTRAGGRFVRVADFATFTSPRLGIWFDTGGPELVVRGPGGEAFLSYVELGARVADEAAHAAAEQRRADREARRADTATRRAAAQQKLAEAERARADDALRQVDAERTKAEQERAKAEQERLRADALAAKLRQLGIDPDEA